MNNIYPILEDVLTDAGNLKSGVHKQIRKQLSGRLKELGFIETENGNLAMKIAEADGKPVYARVDAVVTMHDPFKAKEKKNKKPKENVEVPKLF